MTEVLSQAFALVFIIALGFTFKRAGWARNDHFTMLSRAVLYVTLPAMLMTAFNSFDFTPRLLLLSLFGFGVTMGLHVLGWLMSRTGSHTEKAFGILNVSTFNLGSFATPYVALFIGSHAVIYTSLIDVGVAFATAGIAFGWAKSLTAERGTISPLGFLRLMFTNPVFITYLFLLVMRVLDLHLPEFVINVTTPIGAANPFLAMFMIGIGLEIRLRRDKYRTAFRLLAVRYLVVIAVGIAAWFLLPFERDIRVIVSVVLASPIAVLAAAFTLDTKGDVELSTFMTSISVLVSIVAMPALFLVLS